MLSNMLLATSRNIRRFRDLGLGVTGSGSSLTWTSADLGEATSDRVIVVAVAGASAGSRQVSGVTIGGSAATLAARSSSFTMATGIYYLAVAAGTTANIVASFTGSMDDIAITAYSLTGWGTVSVYDSGTLSSTVTTMSLTGFETSAGGLHVSAKASANAGGSPTVFGYGALDSSHNGTAGYLRLSSHWATPDDTGATSGISSGSSSDKAITSVSFI